MMNVFKQIVDNSLYPIWIKNKELQYCYVNEKYAALHNRRVEECIGLRCEDIYENNIAMEFNNNCFEVLINKDPVIQEVYCRDTYEQCLIIPIKDDNEEIIGIAGIIGIISDVGIIKEKDYQLNVQKKITSNIIDMLPGVIFYKDRQGRYIYANKECRDFYKNIGVDNILGKVDYEINKNKVLAKKFMDDDKFIIESKETIHNEVKFETEEQITYREVVKMPLLDEFGDVIGIVGRSLDITEKMKYQEKLEYLSYTDILTGVKNRTCFEERIKELSGAESLPLAVFMADANGLKIINDLFGHSQGDIFIKNIAKILQEICCEKGEVFRTGGDEFVILIPKCDKEYCEYIVSQVNKKCEEDDNDLFNLSVALGFSIKTNVNEDTYNILKIAEDKVYRQKLLHNKNLKDSILECIKITDGVYNSEINEHSVRVAENAVEIGKELKFTEERLEELRVAALLHDIGKICISEEIFLKPGSLTDEEYEIMKTHTEKGYRILKSSNENINISECALYHHERWDGNGYPLGLNGDEIPIIARIISVCDSYDAMTTNRVYKNAMDKEKAIKELELCSGSQFDPKIVNIFIQKFK